MSKAKESEFIMKKYVVAFPGQGSQYSGMGKELYHQYTIAREIFDYASNVMAYDMPKLCFGDGVEQLSCMEKIQSAILTYSVAAYRVLMQQADCQPEFLIGHSLGEITALVCAGVIKFKDALKLTELRGQLMGSYLGDLGVMIAVMGLEISEIQKICANISTTDYIVEIANYNSHEQIVLSGHKKAITCAIECIDDLGGRVFPLNTGNPFHCSLMKPVVSPLLEMLSTFEYSDFTLPVISNTTAKPYENKNSVKEILSEQIINSVRWLQTIEYMIQQDIFTVVELGPQSVLRNLLMTNEDNVQAYSFDDKNDRQAIREIIMYLCNGLCRDNHTRIDLIQKCLSSFIAMRNYANDKNSYDKNIVSSYMQLNAMLKTIIDEKWEVSFEQIKEVLDSLLTAMHTKGIPQKEQHDRMKYILYSSGYFDVFQEYTNSGVK